MVKVEEVEDLKIWLAKKLELICDADPPSLAKYVIALVKKDKPEKELKESCCEQLDVFLQSKTRVFVEDLFKALNSKEYLKTSVQNHTSHSSTPVTAEKTVDKTLTNSEDVQTFGNSSIDQLLRHNVTVNANIVKMLLQGYKISDLGELNSDIHGVLPEDTKFMGNCHGQTHLTSMSDIRFSVWLNKMRNKMPKAPQLLPPTTEAFSKNVKLAHIQASIWNSALVRILIQRCLGG